MIRRVASLTLLATVVAGCASAETQGEVVASVAVGDKRVSIVGHYAGDQETSFREELAKIAARTGVEISYQPLANINADLVSEVATSQPDIVISPYPQQFTSNDLQWRDLSRYVDIPRSEVSWIVGTAQPGMVGTASFGAPIRLDSKASVWYDSEFFEENGWFEPTTTTDLVRLEGLIRARGYEPWCLSSEQGERSGWALEDWLELGIARSSVDAAVSVSEVDLALTFIEERFNKAVMRDSLGKNAVEGFATPFVDNSRCVMNLAGTYAINFLPADVQAEPGRIGTFQLPANAADSVSLGRIDMVGALTMDSDVQAVLNALIADSFGAAMAKNTGLWLSPHNSFDSRRYSSPVMRDIASDLQASTRFVVDRSDVSDDSTVRNLLVDWVQGRLDRPSFVTEVVRAWNS